MNFKKLRYIHPDITFLKPGEIKEFLGENKNYINLFNDLLLGLRDYFPSGQKNIIDIDFKNNILSVNIESYYPLDNACKLLDEFDEVVGNKIYKETNYALFVYLK
jgi:hypothetical protein